MVPRTPPGETREQVYRFVRGRLLRGRPPTVREVQEALGFRAVQTARAHLEKLVDEGRLAKRAGQARGYHLPGAGRALLDAAQRRLRPATPTVLVPLLGRVQAGELTTALEEREGQVPVRAASADGLFALRVRGESMTGAGILPDDVVVVRQQPTAETGQIVVALVDDEATVKTLRRRGRRVELHPANPAFPVIVPQGEAFRILGKVIEVRRFLDGQDGGFADDADAGFPEEQDG